MNKKVIFMDIKYLLDNCDKPLNDEELQDFITNVANYILSSKAIKAKIRFGTLDDGIAKCYISAGVSMKNNKIIGKNEPNYSLLFDLSQVLSGSAFNSSIVDQLPKKLDIIHTIAHEIEHAIQEEMLSKTKCFSNDYLIIAKERFCYSFYQYYWREFRKESDAEIKGWQTTLEMLNDNSQVSFNKYGAIIQKQIDNIKEYQATAKMSAKIDGKVVTLPASQMITLAASREIKQKPDYALTMYPILKHVYRSDGSKKDYLTLMQERDELIASLSGSDVIKKARRSEIIKFYEDIVNSDIELLEERRNAEFQKKVEMENTAIPEEKPHKHVKIKKSVISKVVLMEQKRKILELKSKMNLENQTESIYENEEDFGMKM